MVPYLFLFLVPSPTNNPTEQYSEDKITAASLADVQTTDSAIIMFTSGTTTVPKGVLHTHSNLLHSCESKRATLHSILEPHGVTLGILPLYHVMGFTNIFLFSLYVAHHVIDWSY